MSPIGMGMQRSIYHFIFAYSVPQQLVLVALTFAALPFIYFQAELPKRIVNDAISADARDFPVNIGGVQLEQFPYLFTLCAIFLGLVLINGGFKYVLNILKGRLGERMLRRLRFTLYSRVLRFPVPHFRRVSQGEIIPMITQEVEPLGGFVGESIATPLYQSGILVTLLVFILVQDPLLGGAAVALFPVQAWLIPRLQTRVNQLAKSRVQNVRRLSDHLGESIAGIAEIRANDSTNYQRALFSQRLGIIYNIRLKIYYRKFAIKFINNFLAQFTPFLFYTSGGYLAIQGDLSVGALVAVISAHKDMNAPWKELLAHYQQREDARIKYEQVVEQFDPLGLLEEHLQNGEDDDPSPFPADATISFRNVSLTGDDGTVYLQHTNFTFSLSEHVAVVGESGSGKEEVGPLLARLFEPTTGRIAIGDDDLANMSEGRIGRRIGYVTAQPYLFAGSVRDNLLLALRHRPENGADDDWRSFAEEAKLAGNSPHNPDDDWVDYNGPGLARPEDLDMHLRKTLHTVMLVNDIYEFGLRGRLDPDQRPELTDRLLAARRDLRVRMAKPEMAGLVESFDRNLYNRNATVAENLLFGTPVGMIFDVDNLGQHPYVRQTLERTGLTDNFVLIGRRVAEIMVDLFADMDTSYDLMAQFSFISPEDLPEFQGILARANRSGGHGLTDGDRARLLSLPFRLAPARHRLGLIDDALQVALLRARQMFADHLPNDLRDAVAFFDEERFNPAATVQDNLLFGKIAYGRPQAEVQVRAALSSVLRDHDLIQAVVDVGLAYDIGVGGGRLSTVQRQKLALARAMIKEPDLLILNNAFSPLDQSLGQTLIEHISAARQGRGILAIANGGRAIAGFSRTLRFEGGQMTELAKQEEPPAKAAE